MGQYPTIDNGQGFIFRISKVTKFLLPFISDFHLIEFPLQTTTPHQKQPSSQLKNIKCSFYFCCLSTSNVNSTTQLNKWQKHSNPVNILLTRAKKSFLFLYFAGSLDNSGRNSIQMYLFTIEQSEWVKEEPYSFNNNKKHNVPINKANNLCCFLAK